MKVSEFRTKLKQCLDLALIAPVVIERGGVRFTLVAEGITRPATTPELRMPSMTIEDRKLPDIIGVPYNKPDDTIKTTSKALAKARGYEVDGPGNKAKYDELGVLTHYSDGRPRPASAIESDRAKGSLTVAESTAGA